MKTRRPTIRECEAWCDRELGRIAREQGMMTPESHEDDVYAEVWHRKPRPRRRGLELINHGDKGKFVQWRDNGDGTGQFTEMTPEELEECRQYQRRRKVKP